MARPRQISDEQICAAMRSCVLEHGPSVSLDLVAKVLSVTPPALLKRFGTRQDLMIAALRPPDDSSWYQALTHGPDGRPLVTQLQEIILRTSAFTAQVMPCVIALRESGIPASAVYSKGSPPLLKGVRALTEWFERARSKGLVGDHELETAATALLGAITTRAFSAHINHRPWTPRAQGEYAIELSQLFTRALVPTASSRAATK